MATAKTPVHVTVTGAAGQIGYSLLFRIASGQLLGPDQPVVLRLLEIEPAMGALQGVVMELDDCAFPLLAGIEPTADTKTAFDGTSWALLVGSIPRKAGMERNDLLTINGGIFGPQGEAIAAHAAADVRVLVVGNPCNTNCLIARAHAPDVPDDRWFAMTRLDQNRAQSLLAHKAGVPVDAVTGLAILGNHSSTQFPDFENARIAGTPVPEVIEDQAWLQGEFITTVQQRGGPDHRGQGCVIGGLGRQRRDRLRDEHPHRHARRRLRVVGRGVPRPVRRPRGARLRLPGAYRRGLVAGGGRARAQRLRPRPHGGDHRGARVRTRRGARSAQLSVGPRLGGGTGAGLDDGALGHVDAHALQEGELPCQ